MPTRHDGAGGDGDVGAEGRRALGLRRSGERRRAHGVMSRVWRWRAKARSLGARQGPAQISREGEWVGAGERPRARRRRGRRRSHDLQLASELRSRRASRCKRAKAAATGADCGREERWFGRTAEADAELAVGEWVGAGERPRARRRRGRRRGRDSSTRSWARDAEASRCASARTAGTEADGGREGRSLRRTAKRRRRARRCRVVGVDARPHARQRQGQRRSRDLVDSHVRLGAEEGHEAQGRGQRP